MPSWSQELAGLRSAAWDELSALGSRLSSHVSPTTSRRVRRYVDLAQRPRAPLVHVAGDDPGCALDHVGHDVQFRHAMAARLGVTRESTRARLPRMWLSPDRVRRSASAPLLLVELERSDAGPFARDGWLVLPRWLRLAVDLRRAERELWDAKKREKVAQIERSGLAVELAPAESVHADFHRDFYAPTAHARHGALAYVRGPRFIERMSRGARVLFVRDGGERVAAVLLAPRGPVLEALVVGVRDGVYQDTALAREAVYLFAIRHARASGHVLLGLTSANPFLDDGLLRFKKRWGAEASVSATDGRAVALCLAQAPASLVAALAPSPIVHLVDPTGTPRLAATMLQRAAGAPRSLRGVEPTCVLEGEGRALIDAFRARARACFEAT